MSVYLLCPVICTPTYQHVQNLLCKQPSLIVATHLDRPEALQWRLPHLVLRYCRRSRLEQHPRDRWAAGNVERGMAMLRRGDVDVAAFLDQPAHAFVLPSLACRVQ